MKNILCGGQTENNHIILWGGLSPMSFSEVRLIFFFFWLGLFSSRITVYQPNKWRSCLQWSKNFRTSKFIDRHKDRSPRSSLSETFPLLLYLILLFKAERQDIKKYIYVIETQTLQLVPKRSAALTFYYKCITLSEIISSPNINF